MSDVLEIEPLRAPFGAEVRGVTWGSPSQELVDELTRALRRHLLLVLRGQPSPTREQLDELFRPFGRLVLETLDGTFHYANFSDDERETVIRTDANYTRNPKEGSGELIWHNDQCFRPQLKVISVLEGIDCAPDAQPTMFRDMYTAFERLPIETKARLSGKQATYIDPRMPSVEEWPRLADSMHPVLLAHPHSGRKALYACGYATRVVGFDADESEEVLASLEAHAQAEAPRYDHHWVDGDLVIWDNVGLQHRRDLLAPGERRTLRFYEGVAE